MDLNAADRDADLAYARCVGIGTALALALVVFELAAYLSGALQPYIPLHELPAYWSLPMKDYLAAARVPSGWGWLALVWKGDYLNFVGIALLASISAAGCVAIARVYALRGDRVYTALALAQLAVLLAAASGLLNSIAGG
jgi:hypothetical protein